MDPEIIRYILEHRTVYTPEAIRRRLVESGHDPAEVDAARRAVESGNLPPPPPGEPPWDLPEGRIPPSIPSELPPGKRAWETGRFWLAFVAYCALLYGISLLLFWQNFTEAGWIFALVALFAGSAACVVLWGRNRPAAMGLLSGILTVTLIPFVGCVVIAGLCFGFGPTGF